MQIGMLSQWYDPETGSAAMAGTIARSLAARGHEVNVLTGYPNYPSGDVYDGYRIRSYQREQLRGVTVHRSPLYPSHDTNAKRRALNYASFAASASALAVTRFPRTDALLVHGTPATAAVPALVQRRLRGVPFVYHVQDMWPQTVLSSSFLANSASRRYLDKVLNRYCDEVYRRAHAIAVTAPGMAGLIEARGVDPSRIHFVSNWADEDVFRPVDPDPQLAQRLGIANGFTVMYAGNLGDLQSLDTLLDAAVALRDRTDIGFVLVGDGVAASRLQDRARSLGLGRVRFIGSQPLQMMGKTLALADVQFIGLKDASLFKTTLPSKLPATLAAGQPVVCAVPGDGASMVKRSGAGLVCPPGDSMELTRSIRRLADADRAALKQMGENGRRYYQLNLSESVGSARLLSLLQDAASSSERSS